MDRSRFLSMDSETAAIGNCGTSESSAGESEEEATDAMERRCEGTSNSMVCGLAMGTCEGVTDLSQRETDESSEHGMRVRVMDCGFDVGFRDIPGGVGRRRDMQAAGSIHSGRAPPRAAKQLA